MTKRPACANEDEIGKVDLTALRQRLRAAALLHTHAKVPYLFRDSIAQVPVCRRQSND